MLILLYLMLVVALACLVLYAAWCHRQAAEFEAVAAHHELMNALEPPSRHGR